MTEKKCLKKINSLVTEYVIAKLVTKRSTDIHLEVMTSVMLLMHKKDTEKIAQKIYELKDTANGMSIFTILDNYADFVIKDFDETKFEELQEVKFSDVTDEFISPAYVLSNSWKVVSLVRSNASVPKFESKNNITLYGNQARYPIIFENQAIVLETYKDLAKELNFDTSLNLSHFFTKLLWEGYFSKDKKHSYQLRDRILEFPTLEVFQGKGVCLNYSALQTQFLKTCGKEAKQVSCLVDTKKIEGDEKYKELIECKIDITKAEETMEKLKFLVAAPLVKLIGNHAITLIGDGNRFFYYDPTNIFVLNPAKDNKASIINGKGEFDIKLEYTLRAHDYSKMEKIEDYLADIITKNTTYDTFTDEDIYSTMTSVFDKMNENASLLNDAYELVRPNILKINEEIEKNKEKLILNYKNKSKF